MKNILIFNIWEAKVCTWISLSLFPGLDWSIFFASWQLIIDNNLYCQLSFVRVPWFLNFDFIFIFTAACNHPAPKAHICIQLGTVEDASIGWDEQVKYI